MRIEERSTRFNEHLKTWVSYWRANPHRFCEEVLGLKLKLFQKFVLCMMFDSITTVLITCRGLGKTFLTAIFCVVRCILYPGTQIVVASKTRKQANEVISKITNILMPNSTILNTEIQSTTVNQYASEIWFRNSSLIRVVTANDNARGGRCNILILDEFRMIDTKIYNTVLKKFLNVNRQPPYLQNDKYSHLTEENKEIFLSSAYYSDNWSFDKTKTVTAQMVSGTFPNFCAAFPYQLAIKENLLTKTRVLSEMTDSTFNSVSWLMEMEAQFYTGSIDGCLFEHSGIEAARNLKYAFLPPSYSKIFGDKRFKIPPKMHNEVRILSVDIALMASQKSHDNDATAIFINRLLLKDNGRSINEIVYGENNEGMRTDEEALTIRRLYNDYDCDVLVIDGRGIGIGVLDLLLADIYDPETGIVYGALSSVNEEIAARCKVKNAPKVIYPVLATADFNSRSALGLRESFKQGAIKLLINEDDFEETMSDVPAFDKLSLEEKTIIKLPYVNTTLLENELISLQYETHNGLVKVKERSTMRKDRYSSLSYSIEIGKQLEKDYKSAPASRSIEELAAMFIRPDTIK